MPIASSNLKVLGIIPSRYASSRLEGKPLLDINGQTMIERVYRQCLKCCSLTKVIVATDDIRIFSDCQSKNMEAVITSEEHQNGTERCAEVLEKINEEFDLIVNIQGDEPFIHPQSITEIIELFQKNPTAEIGSLKKRIISHSDIINPSIIKVVSDIYDKALYFSRSAIPHLRGVEDTDYLKSNAFFKHIGLYAYKPSVLRKIVQLPESENEAYEKLEQLRWLDNGYSIFLAETMYESKSIDTEEDYQYILKNISNYE
jgi:3-deoxy-manno-octulosonate cytidylyltransferase (CMP-KDO synthetase)